MEPAIRPASIVCQLISSNPRRLRGRRNFLVYNLLQFGFVFDVTEVISLSLHFLVLHFQFFPVSLWCSVEMSLTSMVSGRAINSWLVGLIKTTHVAGLYRRRKRTRCSRLNALTLRHCG